MVLLAVGIVLLLVLWTANLSMARNMSSGGLVQFPGVLTTIAVPAVELGLLLGLLVRGNRSDWPSSSGVGRLTKVIWALIAANYVLWLQQGVY